MDEPFERFIRLKSETEALAAVLVLRLRDFGSDGRVDHGHGGTMAHVRDQLAFLLADLGDRRAVDRLGLKH